MLRGLLVVMLALTALAPVGAAEYRNEIGAFPARVEEERPFRISVCYAAPARAVLHCELKNTANVVIGGQTAEVTGEGTREFTLQAPARSAASELLVGVWLGEEWQKALAPIRHTPVIRVVSHAEQRRLDAMQSEAQTTLARLGYRRSAAGNIALLDDDLPGLDRRAPRLLADALGRRGFAVTRLDAAALAILVCGNTSRETCPGNWHLDCAAATQNLLLAVHEAGLGAVWTGVYPDAQLRRAFQAFFGLPEEVMPLALVPIGIPDEQPEHEDRYMPERVHRNQW
jgi:nitroreductase